MNGTQEGNKPMTKKQAQAKRNADAMLEWLRKQVEAAR
jgi:hypothetical protein